MPEYMLELDGEDMVVSIDMPADAPVPAEIIFTFRPATSEEFVETVERLKFSTLTPSSATQFEFGLPIRRNGSLVGEAVVQVAVPQDEQQLRPSYASVHAAIERRQRVSAGE